MLLLLACTQPNRPRANPPTVNRDVTIAWYTDSDGDGWGAGEPVVTANPPAGWVAVEGDCDDGNAHVHPGVATDVCDGADTDCDSLVDEDGEGSLWPDADGDGWGDVGPETWGCPTQGLAVVPGDCDDADPLTRPDGVEVCGGGDEDCDGEVDEPAAADATLWYPDVDQDRYGDREIVERACVRPGMAIATGGDCNDADREIHPDAQEHCGEDRDCDGLYDEPGAARCEDWYVDLDGDGWGSETSACLCGPDGDYSAAEPYDCDDGNSWASPFGVCGWVGPTTLSGSDLRIRGAAAGDFLGDVSPASAGDLDGDGADDLVVTAAYAGTNAGAVYAFSTPGSGDLDATDATVTLTGADGDRAGSDHDAGDLDGDGDDDLIVSVPYEDSDEPLAGGAVYLLRDVFSAGSLADADARLLCEPGTADYLLVAYAGDTEGDGVARVLVAAGALYSTLGAWVYLVEGDATGDVSLADEELRVRDEDVSATDLAAGADIDGDGIEDIVVSTSGGVYVLYGPFAGRTFADADSTLWGQRADRIAVGGDTDGDGLPDLMLGGGGNSAWIVTDPGSGSVDVERVATELVTDADYVSIPGDVDGDGFADVLLGVSSVNEGDGVYDTSGRAWLVYGPVTSGIDVEADFDASFSGDAAGDGAGAVSGAGDLDGDGLADFAVSASSADAEAGMVSVFFGLAR